MSDEHFNLKERVLCSDDACIGLVGPDGRCKVCGAAYTGSEPLPDVTSGPSPVPVTPENYDESESEPPLSVKPADVSHDVSERVCCPDDTCIGIIGEDGKCGTCGKSS